MNFYTRPLPRPCRPGQKCLEAVVSARPGTVRPQELLSVLEFGACCSLGALGLHLPETCSPLVLPRTRRAPQAAAGGGRGRGLRPGLRDRLWRTGPRSLAVALAACGALRIPLPVAPTERQQPLATAPPSHP